MKADCISGNACMTCRHFIHEIRLRDTCAAFPDGIPATILTAQLDHRSPVPGDHGIRWEPKPEYAFMLEAEEVG